MKEKTQSEKIAANRQVELLTTAMEQAKANGGVWLNADRKLGPMLHRKEVRVSGFNSLMLAIASDQHHYETNLYTFYSDARRLSNPVRDKERGVPFNWYKWDTYVNRNNPNDIISKEDYQKLPTQQDKAQYKGVWQREIRWLFNLDQTILPMKEPDRYDQLVAQCGSAEARKAPSYEDDKPLRIAVNDFQLKMRDNLVDIRHDGTGLTYYDTDKNAIHLAAQNTFADYPHFVQELLRNVVAATGHQQRLAREGMVAKGGTAPSDDAVKQEKLVQELASGIKMQQLGLPATLTKEGMALADYWVRELKENPKLIDIVERDVNNSLNLIRRAERGEKIEMASKVNAVQTEKYKEQVPMHFYIADEIKLHPSKDEKLFVVVKDAKTKIADVILPQGASVERNNEVPGMSKDRIERALEKQGYSNVRFYNPDGAFGYRPDDAYFAGKEVTVARLKNWKLVEDADNPDVSEAMEDADKTDVNDTVVDVNKIDIRQAVEHASQMEFDRVQMVQDDNHRWALFVKPEGKESFAIYPDKADINRFFTTLKQSQENIDGMRLELANKYYAMAEARPELKIDLFGKGQASEVDKSRIQKVNMFKGKNDVILCAAVIEGAGRLEPRVVSPQQWQRMWLSDDRDAYKKNLAAKLYADVLQQERSTEAKQDASKDEKAKTGEKQDQGQQQTQGQQQEQKASEDKRPKIPWTWDDLKKRHPDAMLMFRQGDFYSLFREDARKGSEILSITMDKIRDDVDRASFPYHCLDTYLPKLIRSGCRVAICDELKQPVKEETNRVEKEQAAGQEETRSHGLKR